VAYDLWDQETANLCGSYRSLDAALKAVADTVSRYGRASAEVKSLALTRGRFGAVAAGDALAALASDDAERHASRVRKRSTASPASSKRTAA
jgi:hypothetical protein